MISRINSFFEMCLLLMLLHALMVVNARPLQRRGVNIHRNRDGSISGSIGFSKGISGAGLTGAIGFSQTFNVGPKGSKFSGSNSASLNNRFTNTGFSNSGTFASNSGLFGSSGSNSNSNSFRSPYLSTANTNANAYANQLRRFG